MGESDTHPKLCIEANKSGIDLWPKQQKMVIFFTLLPLHLQDWGAQYGHMSAD